MELLKMLTALSSRKRLQIWRTHLKKFGISICNSCHRMNCLGDWTCSSCLMLYLLWCEYMTSQKSKNETLVRLESPLPLRAIPNCQMDGSPPAPPLALPPSVAEPAPPLSSSPRWPGERPRGDSPRKSKLYWIKKKEKNSGKIEKKKFWS